MENTAQTQNPTAQPTPPTVVVPPIGTGNNTSEKPKFFIPKKTLILIIVLAVLTLVLLALALRVSLPQGNQATKAPTVVSHAYSVLSIAQPVASGSAYTANINITTSSNKVTAAQLELKYDPKLIEVSDITAGAFFNNPVPIIKKIEPENGRITFALGIGLGQKPVNGQGTVAVITFTPLAQQQEQAKIDILPISLVAADGEDKTVLKSYTGLTISTMSALLTP
jgi:cytoskeletal protein RodZ